MKKNIKYLLVLFLFFNINTNALISLNLSNVNLYEILPLTEGEKSTDNTLKMIYIDGKEIKKFDPDNISYDVGDKTAYVFGDFDNRDLKYGLNVFKIYVKSEAGERREYIINVTRVDDRENVNTLKSLTLSVGEINFDPKISEYEVVLDESVEKIKIESVLTSQKADYVKGYGNREVLLNVGLNHVLVKVRAENNEEMVYTLNIIRGQYSYENAKNVNIKNIVIDGYQLLYSNDLPNYTLRIKDEKKLDIKVELENEKATSQILNNSNLKNGSVITIKVISEDGSEEKKVSITVEKDQVESIVIKKERTISDLIIEFVCLSFFIISMVVFGWALKRYNKK